MNLELDKDSYFYSFQITDVSGFLIRNLGMRAKKPCLCTVSGYRISDGLTNSKADDTY